VWRRPQQLERSRVDLAVVGADGNRYKPDVYGELNDLLVEARQVLSILCADWLQGEHRLVVACEQRGQGGELRAK
jgi:hypothetical protein